MRPAAPSSSPPPRSISAVKVASHVRDGTQSASVNATHRPRAASQPVLRAAPAPPGARVMTRVAIGVATFADPSVEPSSTTMTS